MSINRKCNRERERTVSAGEGEGNGELATSRRGECVRSLSFPLLLLLLWLLDVVVPFGDGVVRCQTDPRLEMIRSSWGLGDVTVGIRAQLVKLGLIFLDEGQWNDYDTEISQWPPIPIIMIDSKTHTIMVEACDFCGEFFHPTYVCPYHLRYGNHHSSSYASPQPNFYMSRPSPQIPQQEWRTIKDIEKDMIFEWLSPSTNACPFEDWSNSSSQPDTYSSMQNQPSRDIIRFLLYTEQDMNLTEQELDQWIEQNDQEAEEEIKSILQKILAETMNAISLKSVEVNEVTPIEDYWSELEEIIEVSLHEPDISIAQNEADEAKKEIDVILERPEEPQKRSKED
ncbi:hypothetical protein Sjap_003170 [Stephania japonica]|uniref:C2H2-type domain-containing protein n=1 Tax=Stephania japonica TaxID=461633 RepID=A0AAP0KP57_9MAGN